MPRLENPELFKEFYEQNAHKYPMMSYEQVKECCSMQFLYAKKLIANNELPVIRLKYFGTFMVYEGKARGMLNAITRKFQELLIEPKYYFAKKAMLEKFLEKREQFKEEEDD